MPALFDYLERAVTGPIMTQKDFQMKILIPNVRRIVKEFDIAYDPAVPVSSDNALADRLFEAAIEFLALTGLYCEGTNRIIQFDGQEIRKGLGDYKKAGTFGEGRDRSVLTPRKPGDTQKPWCHLGNGIVASSDEIAMALVEGFASVPQAKSVTIPAPDTIRGLPIMGGSPLELYGVISSIESARKALWRAGRPGLAILNLCPAATTATGAIAGCHPSTGARPSDGWLIDYLAEMTIDFNNLNKLAFITYMGANVGSTDLPILGGYAGGAPGTALVMASYQIAGCVFMKGDYHLSGPVEMNLGCSSTRAALWVYSVVGRAISRNTNYCVLANQYAMGGPATKTYFYEATAELLAVVTSGFAGFESCHPARGIVKDGITPTEPQFNADLADGIAQSGMQADSACELCNRLLEKYEAEIKMAPPEIQGKTYSQLYDIKTHKRFEEYDRLYDEVVEELIQMDIPLS